MPDGWLCGPLILGQIDCPAIYEMSSTIFCVLLHVGMPAYGVMDFA